MPVAVGPAVTPSLVATEEDGGPGASWPPGALPGLCSPARPWARRPQRLSPLGCASPRRVPLSCRGAPLPLGCASPLGVRLSPWDVPLPLGCASPPGVRLFPRGATLPPGCTSPPGCASLRLPADSGWFGLDLAYLLAGLIPQSPAKPMGRLLCVSREPLAAVWSASPGLCWSVIRNFEKH